MEYPVLNRAKFLIEHADVSRTLPQHNPADRLLRETSAILAEQRMLSTLLICSLLEEISDVHRSMGV